VLAGVLKGPWRGVDVSVSDVDAGEEDAPGAGDDEVEALEASDAGAAGEGSGEGAEAFGDGEPKVGGCGLGDEEGPLGKGEEIPGEAVWSLGDGRQSLGRRGKEDAVVEGAGVREGPGACGRVEAAGKDHAGQDEDVGRAEEEVAGVRECGIQHVGIEDGVFGKGEGRRRCAGRGEEAPLGKAGGEMREQVGFDPQAGGLSGIAAEGEEVMEASGGPFGLGWATGGRQSWSEGLAHGAFVSGEEPEG
jgi:hypothetical protein